MNNSKEAHKNMTAKIGLHGEMIMSQLPFLYTQKEKFSETMIITKGGYTDRGYDIITNGATCEGIARYACMTELQVVRRMSELERAGLVERCTEKFTYVQDGRTYHRTIWRVKE